MDPWSFSLSVSIFPFPILFPLFFLFGTRKTSFEKSFVPKQQMAAAVPLAVGLAAQEKRDRQLAPSPADSFAPSPDCSKSACHLVQNCMPLMQC